MFRQHGADESDHGGFVGKMPTWWWTLVDYLKPTTQRDDYTLVATRADRLQR